MDEWLETLFKLDTAGDYQEVIKYVATSSRQSQDLVFALYRLFIEARFQSAYVIARLLTAMGVQHPLVFLALALGGVMFGNDADQEQGTARLAAVIDLMAQDKQDSFYANVFYAVSLSIVNRVLALHSPDAMLRLLEVLKAATPCLRQIFDFSAEALPFDLDAARRRGRERSQLLQMAGPPAGSPRASRRVIVAIREFVFPSKPNSRTFDGGPRLCAAMNAYGWNATLCNMAWNPVLLDYRNIAAICREAMPDVLVLDDNLIEAASVRQPRLEMIRELHQHVPSLRILALYLDPWQLPAKELIDGSGMLDAVWAIAPTMPVWQDRAFAGKMFQAPLPLAGNYGQPQGPPPEKMIFMGGVQGYNWHRAFWQAAANRAGLPIEWRLSEHKSDGLSTLDSYALYIKGLSQAGASLNFSMRPNLSRVIASRAFETVAAGALLVEEEARDLDYYLVSGEHYLEFSSFAELRALIRFVAERPEEAEAVRRAGNRYFLDRYSDDQIISYLDCQLFHRHA